MKAQQEIDKVTLDMKQILNEYEVIPANWGWHIHKGNTYCGHLQYQGKKGWQGSALSRLPSEVRAKLKNFAQSGSSGRYAMI